MPNFASLAIADSAGPKPIKTTGTTAEEISQATNR